MNFKFYVYAYIRKKSSMTAMAGTPYYIGKGSGQRAFTSHGRVAVPARDLIVILESNLTEFGAFALERRMIQWWGRKDLSSGILLNKTDGGDGAAGSKPTRKPHSEETKAKIRAGNIGKKQSEETRIKISNARSGSHLTESQKQHLSLLKKGIPKSDETKAKMKAAKQNMSDETIQKIAASSVGKPKSAAHRKNLSDAVKAYMTPEHRLKLSLAAKNRKCKPLNG